MADYFHFATHGEHSKDSIGPDCASDSALIAIGREQAFEAELAELRRRATNGSLPSGMMALLETAEQINMQVHQAQMQQAANNLMAQGPLQAGQFQAGQLPLTSFQGPMPSVIVPKAHDDQADYLRDMLAEVTRERDAAMHTVHEMIRELTALRQELTQLRVRTEQRDASVVHAIRTGRTFRHV